VTARVEIPKELAARVLFASDKTCCVCRLERTKVQIHHIDGNPSHNEFANLAVICLNCHSDAHSTGAFVRNLTPELIALYNDSWRQVSAMRLLPSGSDPTKQALQSEVYLEVSLDCHSWKVQFMRLRGAAFPSGSQGEYQDVWDAMKALWLPTYTPEAYELHRPLFEVTLRVVQERIDRAALLYADVLPFDFRATLLRANRQLTVEREVYGFIPQLEALSAGEAEGTFRGRFVGTIQVLTSLSREADGRRELLSAATGPAA